MPPPPKLCLCHSILTYAYQTSLRQDGQRNQTKVHTLQRVIMLATYSFYKSRKRK